MSDCRFRVSPVNYPDPDPDLNAERQANEVLVPFLHLWYDAAGG